VSTQAEMAFLKEEITEAENARKVFAVCTVIGVVVELLTAYYFQDLNANLIALIVMICSGIAYFHFDSKKKRLYGQLKQLEFKSKCSKCGNPLPDRNFDFCPFCGESLKSKCSKCGKSLPEGNFLFCPFCSASLSKKSAPES